MSNIKHTLETRYIDWQAHIPGCAPSIGRLVLVFALGAEFPSLIANACLATACVHVPLGRPSPQGPNLISARAALLEEGYLVSAGKFQAFKSSPNCVMVAHLDSMIHVRRHEDAMQNARGAHDCPLSMCCATRSVSLLALLRTGYLGKWRPG